MGLPTYNVGTASVANGNQSVSFAGGAALTGTDPTTGATLAVCGPGDFLVVAGSGGAFGVIQTVTDATHVTLETPWAGSTNATAAYKIYRQSVPLTGSAAALAQTVLNQGSDSQPDLSRTIDSGVARLKARIGTDGKAKLSVGPTGTADASLLDGLSIDPTTGAASFPNGVKEYVLGFRNRLVNGDFRIWQRGTSFSVANATETKTADMWSVVNNNLGVTLNVSQVVAPTGFVLGGIASAQQAVVSASAAAGLSFESRHRFESLMVRDLDAQAAVLAFDVLATTTGGAVTGEVVLALNSAVDNSTYSNVTYDAVYTVPVGAGRVRIPLTAAQMTGVKLGGMVLLRFLQSTSAGAMTVTVGSVQLEKGAVANDFEFRPLALELEMCRRYFRRFTAPVLRGLYNGASTAGRMALPLSPPMRIGPSVSLPAALQLFNAIAATTSTSISANYSTPDSLELDLAMASATGFSVGDPVITYQGAGQLDASAEL